MQPYKNLSKTDAHVSEYEIGDDHIIIKFTKPGRSGFNTYKYSYNSAGKDNVETMKQLAEAGEGLRTFVNDQLRKMYESRS